MIEKTCIGKKRTMISILFSMYLYVFKTEISNTIKQCIYGIDNTCYVPKFKMDFSSLHLTGTLLSVHLMKGHIRSLVNQSVYKSVFKIHFEF